MFLCSFFVLSLCLLLFHLSFLYSLISASFTFFQSMCPLIFKDIGRAGKCFIGKSNGKVHLDHRAEYTTTTTRVDRWITEIYYASNSLTHYHLYLVLQGQFLTNDRYNNYRWSFCQCVWVLIKLNKSPSVNKSNAVIKKKKKSSEQPNQQISMYAIVHFLCCYNNFAYTDIIFGLFKNQYVS